MPAPRLPPSERPAEGLPRVPPLEARGPLLRLRGQLPRLRADGVDRRPGGDEAGRGAQRMSRTPGVPVEVGSRHAALLAEGDPALRTGVAGETDRVVAVRSGAALQSGHGVRNARAAEATQAALRRLGGAAGRAGGASDGEDGSGRR